MIKVVIQAGQNIGDIAIQYCGDHQAIFEIAQLNGLSVTDEVVAGQLIKIPATYDERISRFYQENNYEPATEGERVDGGISSMGIEVDFIVR